jgi:hypothetical protein
MSGSNNSSVQQEEAAAATAGVPKYLQDDEFSHERVQAEYELQCAELELAKANNDFAAAKIAVTTAIAHAKSDYEEAMIRIQASTEDTNVAHGNARLALCAVANAKLAVSSAKMALEVFERK